MTTPNACGDTGTVKSPPTYPDDLTAREVEVLRLVALGMTDAQVADKLVLSPRTIGGHLAVILSDSEESGSPNGEILRYRSE